MTRGTFHLILIKFYTGGPCLSAPPYFETFMKGHKTHHSRIEQFRENNEVKAPELISCAYISYLLYRAEWEEGSEG